MIGAIKASEMTPMGLPSWATGSSPASRVVDAGAPPDPKFATGLRSSDLMPGHFRAFSAVTADAVLDGGHRRQPLGAEGHPGQPQHGDRPVPGLHHQRQHDPRAGARQLVERQRASDGRYGYTAARVPAAAWLPTTSPARASRPPGPRRSWPRSTTGSAGAKTMGNPAKIVDGYQLDDERRGRQRQLPVREVLRRRRGHRRQVPALARRHLGPGQRRQHRHPADGHADSVRLLSLIVMSGNWWAP